MESKELTLTHVSVIFAELNENNSKGFARSITIDTTEPDVLAFITKWAETNNYNVRIKDYDNGNGEITKQVTFKFSKYIKIAGKDGLSEKDLTRGAKVNLIVRTYEYNSPMGSGISASITNLFIVEGGKSKMNTIAE